MKAGFEYVLTFGKKEERPESQFQNPEGCNSPYRPRGQGSSSYSSEDRKLPQVIAWAGHSQTASWRATAQAEERGCPCKLWGESATPVGLEGKASRQRRLFLNLKMQRNLPYWFWTSLEPDTPFFFLEWGSPSDARPTIVIWKHVTCLVSKVHS